MSKLAGTNLNKSYYSSQVGTRGSDLLWEYLDASQKGLGEN